MLRLNPLFFKLAHSLVVCSGEIARDNSTIRQVSNDDTADFDIAIHPDSPVVRDRHTRPYLGTCPDYGTASDLAARADQTVLVQFDIVSDLGQVADLAAVANHGRRQTAAVDAGVAADGNVFAYRDSTDMWEMLQRAIRLPDMAEPRGANDATGTYFHIITQPHIGIDDDAGVDHHVLPHSYILRDTGGMRDPHA